MPRDDITAPLVHCRYGGARDERGDLHACCYGCKRSTPAPDGGYYATYRPSLIGGVWVCPNRMPG